MSYRTTFQLAKSWNVCFARIFSLFIASACLSFHIFPFLMCYLHFTLVCWRKTLSTTWIVQKIKLMSKYSETVKITMATICKWDFCTLTPNEWDAQAMWLTYTQSHLHIAIPLQFCFSVYSCMHVTICHYVCPSIHLSVSLPIITSVFLSFFFSVYLHNFHVFRCVHASLYEGLSIHGPSVVRRSHVFF